jgi:subtilase family serine protease
MGRNLKAVTALASLAVAGAALPGAAVARPQNHMLPAQFATQPTSAQCQQTLGINCYNAFQIERAYGVLGLRAHGINGQGRTIVIVDSFGSPTIKHDLAVFDSANLLPAPPSFKVIAPAGAIPPFDPTNTDMVGWAEETTLDVEMAHTIAPGANILLVETPVSETEGITGFPQIIQAENYVIDNHLGDVISQSFSATEQSFVNASGGFDPDQILGLQSSYENAAANGVTVLAATGDSGAADVGVDGATYFNFPVVSFPPDDPQVTAVGGLNLWLNALGGRTAADTVWNDPNSVCASPCAGNGGLSVVFGRPSFQDSVQSVVGSDRGVPDVSLSASVSGAVNTYTSFTAPDAGVPGPGWYAEAGTSEATPLFAGEVALADQIAGHGLGVINPYLYEMGDGSGSGLTDITSGNNTVDVTQGGDTFVVSGYNAGPGYDLASGVGEPNASFPAQLAALATQP